MDMLEHALARSVIHFFSAMAVCGLIRFGMMTLERRFMSRRMSGYVWLGLPCVLAALLVFLREPLDVAAGGPVWKSYLFDLPSWFAGSVASAWLTYRLAARDAMAVRDIVSRDALGEDS